MAPVTAESLRERIAWLRDRWYQRPGLSGQADALDAALDEFAQDASDPGDLPARMAEAIDSEHNPLEPFDAGRLAAAAMSVRWEDHAATVAENAQLRARVEHAEGELSSRIEQHQRAVTHWITAGAEAGRLRAEVDRLADFGVKSRERHRAEIKRLRAELAEETAQLEALRRLANHGAERARHVRAQRDALKTTVERIRRAAVDVYGEDYDGEDVAAEVGRLLAHLSEYEANMRRILQAKNEALERAYGERDKLRTHILDIDAHATPFGDIPDEPGYVGTYLLTAGALHRALGKIGHTAPKCQAEVERDALKAAAQHLLDTSTHPVTARAARIILDAALAAPETPGDA